MRNIPRNIDRASQIPDHKTFYVGIAGRRSLGYSSSDAKSSNALGRARFYFLTVSAFADIPVTEVIVPYVGGGMGAVRVDTDLSWANVLTDTDVTTQGKA